MKLSKKNINTSRSPDLTFLAEKKFRMIKLIFDKGTIQDVGIL